MMAMMTTMMGWGMGIPMEAPVEGFEVALLGGGCPIQTPLDRIQLVAVPVGSSSRSGNHDDNDANDAVF